MGERKPQNTKDRPQKRSKAEWHDLIIYNIVLLKHVPVTWINGQGISSGVENGHGGTKNMTCAIYS